jgi:hypothetical protein
MKPFTVYKISNIWFSDMMKFIDGLIDKKTSQPIELRKLSEDGMQLLTTIDSIKVVPHKKEQIYTISISIDEKIVIPSRDKPTSVKITNSADLIIFKSNEKVNQFMIVFSSQQKSDKLIDMLNFILKEKNIAGEINNVAVEKVEFDLDYNKIVDNLSPIEFKGVCIEEIQGDIQKARFGGDRIEDTDEFSKFTTTQHGKLYSVRLKIPFENKLVKVFLRLGGCGFLSDGMTKLDEKETIQSLFYKIVNLIKSI